MNTILKLVSVCFLLSTIIISCSDNEDFSVPTTIKVVNLINGVDNIFVKIGDNPINYEATKANIEFDDFKNFSILKNTNKQLEIVKGNDTINPIYSEILNLEGIHSLYLIGDQEEIESFLIKDNPKQLTDSIVGIRFLNLSKTSGPINISIEGEAENIISGLEYQSGSEYIEFPAKEIDGSYEFKFVDTSGNIFRDYFETIDPLDEDDVSVKKNFTLVITEIEAFSRVLYKITRVNSY